MKSKKDPVVLDRRCIGIHVSMHPRGPPSFHAIYEVSLLEETRKGLRQYVEVQRGQLVRIQHNFKDLNGTKEERAKSLLSFKPEFRDHILAAHPLIETMSAVAENIDRKLGLDFGTNDPEWKKTMVYDKKPRKGKTR